MVAARSCQDPFYLGQASIYVVTRIRDQSDGGSGFGRRSLPLRGKSRRIPFYLRIRQGAPGCPNVCEITRMPTKLVSQDVGARTGQPLQSA